MLFRYCCVKFYAWRENNCDESQEKKAAQEKRKQDAASRNKKRDARQAEAQPAFSYQGVLKAEHWLQEDLAEAGGSSQIRDHRRVFDLGVLNKISCAERYQSPQDGATARSR